MDNSACKTIDSSILFDVSGSIAGGSIGVLPCPGEDYNRLLINRNGVISLLTTNIRFAIKNPLVIANDITSYIATMDGIFQVQANAATRISDTNICTRTNAMAVYSEPSGDYVFADCGINIMSFHYGIAEILFRTDSFNGCSGVTSITYALDSGKLAYVFVACGIYGTTSVVKYTIATKKAEVFMSSFDCEGSYGLKVLGQKLYASCVGNPGSGNKISNGIAVRPVDGSSGSGRITGYTCTGESFLDGIEFNAGGGEYGVEIYTKCGRDLTKITVYSDNRQPVIKRLLTGDQCNPFQLKFYYGDIYTICAAIDAKKIVMLSDLDTDYVAPTSPPVNPEISVSTDPKQNIPMIVGLSVGLTFLAVCLGVCIWKSVNKSGRKSELQSIKIMG